MDFNDMCFEEKTYMNALGIDPKLGATRLPREVLSAMRQAASGFIDLIELQEAVSAELSEWMNCEAVRIVSSAQAGLMLCAAAAISGSDRYQLSLLPEKGREKTAAVYREDRWLRRDAVCAAGCRLMELSAEDNILNEVNAVFLSDIAVAADIVAQTQVRVAREKGIKVIVDAVRWLPAPEDIRKLFLYADAAVFGGETMLGPMQSGIVAGSSKFVLAVSAIIAPKHGIGRSCKTGKEEMIGLFTAVNQYFRPGAYRKTYNEIVRRNGLVCSCLSQHGIPAKTNSHGSQALQTYPVVSISLDEYKSNEILTKLKQNGIWAKAGLSGGVLIDTLFLDDGDAAAVAKEIIHLLKGDK